MEAENHSPRAVLPREGDVVADKYLVEGMIAQGGMGAVFRARHVVSEKPVAIKWILPERSGTNAEARMIREARATARIDHPNVVDVYDVGHHGNSIYLVMEFLRGETLADRIERGVLSPEEAVEVIIPAMRGVAAAHAEGVVHRDLKPDNIMLCCGPHGAVREPKVLDFGISKFADAEVGGGKHLTRTQAILGTPHYMSPEQARGSADVDYRCDIYAFGVILYELLSGQLPYWDDTYNGLIVKIATTPPWPLDKVRPDLPKALVEVVMRALSARPEDRYQSVAELAHAIEPFGPGVLFAPSRLSDLYGRTTDPSGTMPRATPMVTTAASLSSPGIGTDPTMPSGTDAPRRPTPSGRVAVGRGDTILGQGLTPAGGKERPVTTSTSPRVVSAPAPVPRRGVRWWGLTAAACLLFAAGFWANMRPDPAPQEPTATSEASALEAAEVRGAPAAPALPELVAAPLPQGEMPAEAAAEAPAAGVVDPAEASATDDGAAAPATAADEEDDPAKARTLRERRLRRKQAQRGADAPAAADAASAPPRLADDWDERLPTGNKPKAAAPRSAAGAISIDDL